MTKQENQNVSNTQKCYHVIVRVFNRKNKNGFSFKAYATKINNKWCDVSFTKDVKQEDLPITDCELIVPANLINKSNKNGYDRFWIQGWLSKFDLEKPIEDLGQYFETSEEELPF